jgi:hypothetical protein
MASCWGSWAASLTKMEMAGDCAKFRPYVAEIYERYAVQTLDSGFEINRKKVLMTTAHRL